MCEKDNDIFFELCKLLLMEKILCPVSERRGANRPKISGSRTSVLDPYGIQLIRIRIQHFRLNRYRSESKILIFDKQK
jgi:hypothetical protein